MGILIETSPNQSGPQNMQRDLDLFRDFEQGKIGPILRVYSWNPSCISLGYSQSVEKLLNLAAVKKLGWDIVKRPTGGGMVFHNTDEVTFSLILPYDYPGLPLGLMPSYKYLAQAIVGFLRELGINADVSANRHPKQFTRPSHAAAESREIKRQADLCFSYPADYEIVAAGKKIAGCAQKRGKKGFLQQGSIFVSRKDFTQFKRFLIDSSAAGLESAVSIDEIIGVVPDFKNLSESLVNNFRRMMV
ncbi:MAG: biotin/lipoate A/B protein ligase family protein, partial [Candidatus Margulisiibacteriota bacterium]